MSNAIPDLDSHISAEALLLSMVSDVSILNHLQNCQS